ncbi:MAG: SAM-dependent methyltransferase [Coxiella sp. RIFCSPHIGHO2_12_FULL_44_14]|nr:MAG: SAM-dependent methyltransferase [Coxiella sp. RIFCSPHIGHO2_12_FULL_44_14]
MTNRTLSLTSDLYQYLLDVSLHESSILRELRAETELMPESRMQISPDQGQLFTFLLKLIQARYVIDIGTFTGYSALIAALAMPEEGRVVTCDVDERATAVAERYWKKAGVSHKIELKLAPALVTLDQLLSLKTQNSVDFIFIDADKQNYDNYYERALSLLHPGGLVAIDNVLWDGRVIDETDHDNTTQAIRHLNTKLSGDSRVDMCMVPIGDGVTFVRKR